MERSSLSLNVAPRGFWLSPLELLALALPASLLAFVLSYVVGIVLG